ncbi:unnamed protein product [Lymnaea stagnalis]|uniref:Transmembrane protein n=1 Tax=Lymnaea stagnalis TaxID=6523 RepID=A0AAV2I9I7_LYMST
MVQRDYSVGQRVAFAGLTIGFLMCAVGAIAPFWVTAKVSLDSVTKIFGESIPIIGSIELLSMHGGLWWNCVELVAQESKCEANSLENSTAGDWVIRVGSAVNVLLSLFCALAALCRSCCCGGGKTVCHGVMAFFAGAAGVAVVVVFSQSMEDFFFYKLSLVKYGWAFFVYIAGSALVTIMSFVLCFASPMNPFTPMIVNGVGHILPTGYTRMTNDHVQLDQPVTFQNDVVYPQHSTSRY